MIYKFTDYEIDTAKAELRAAGVRRAVEPQDFALLRLLVEHRQRLVSKDEIIQSIWAARIVSDSALSTRVKSALQAIGDDGVAQRWIRTHHGHGFRLVGEVAASLQVTVDNPMGGPDDEGLRRRGPPSPYYLSRSREPPAHTERSLTPCRTTWLSNCRACVGYS